MIEWVVWRKEYNQIVKNLCQEWKVIIDN